MTSVRTRSGFAALIGRPNVGKSTLLNQVLGEKIAIVSPKPQTTRTRIVGVVTRPDWQIALVDTPGIHEAHGALNRFMVEHALGAAAECDVVLFLVEAELLKPGEGPQIRPANRQVLERVKQLRKPTVLVINKVDAVPKPHLLPLIALYREAFAFAEIVPVSAKTGDGVEMLLDVVAKLMPAAEPMFPPDVFTDQAERTLVGEYVREQVLRHCRQEVPYSTAVAVEVFDESDRDAPPPSGKKKRAADPTKPVKTGLVRIHASVYVERESQKAIIIGKRGAMLKTIGTDARLGIERLLGTNVFLSLQVKVEPKWTERADGLRRVGYEPTPLGAQGKRRKQ